MKASFKFTVSFCCVFGASLFSGLSQSFINLDFECPTYVPNPPYIRDFVAATSAIPGWTAYTDGNPYPDILYNDISLSGGFVTLWGPGSGATAPHGDYYLSLAGDFPGDYMETTTGVGQIGQIPSSALSLTFLGNFYGLPDQVSFAGNPLSVQVIGTTPNYNIYQADLSQYSGQTGELLFTTALGGEMSLDNIQFSTSPVPEPNSFGVFALGGLFVVWRHRRKGSG
jgi:hypothetical protein